MAYGNEILRRLEELNIVNEVEEVARTKERELADANRFQLSEGKDNTGRYLPRYVDDPYFKSPAQAKAYEDWKAKVSPNREKPRDVMDFYINGFFYDSINVKIGKGTINFFTDAPFGVDVERKTNFKVLGFNPETRRETWEFFIKPALLKRIAAKTGAKINR